jgi:hypothetical protein
MAMTSLVWWAIKAAASLPSTVTNCRTTASLLDVSERMGQTFHIPNVITPFHRAAIKVD